MLASAIWFSSCGESKSKKETINKKENTLNDSIKIAIEDSVRKSNEAIKEQAKARMELLKKNFKYKYDEFKKIGFYSHKNQYTNRKCLITTINSEGYIYLTSLYHADNWIFHTRIEVKIGDQIYKSGEVPTYNEDNITQNDGGYVWEQVRYMNEIDNGIIKAISESGKNEIKVRFIGGKFHNDITLNKKDKQAIIDSYELSQLIKKLKE